MKLSHLRPLEAQDGTLSCPKRYSIFKEVYNFLSTCFVVDKFPPCSVLLSLYKNKTIFLHKNIINLTAMGQLQKFMLGIEVTHSCLARHQVCTVKLNGFIF